LGSLATRARIVSLTSRVSAIATFLFFPFVVLPVGKGGSYILLLALFRAATEQNHQAPAVLSQIDSVTGPKIDPAFEHTRTNALDVREVADSQSGDGNSHLGSRLRI
jgi:hypothetical protein